MIQGSRVDRESTHSFSRRRFAKIAVATLGVAGFAIAGLPGALAHDGDGWDDDLVFPGISGSGGPGGSGWDDDWDDD